MCRYLNIDTCVRICLYGQLPIIASNRVVEVKGVGTQPDKVPVLKPSPDSFIMAARRNKAENSNMKYETGAQIIYLSRLLYQTLMSTI